MEGLLFMPPKANVEAYDAFRNKILRSLEAVQFIQHNFSNFIDSSNDWHQSEIEGISKDVGEKVQKYRITGIRSQRFSDGLVLFFPLREDGHYPLGSTYSALCACASMMLCGLDRGFPFRAGIAIGAGCSLNSSDIYGPALAEAYRLESKVAVYPRVVLSDSILEWLDSFENKSYASAEDQRVAYAMKEKCKEMLMHDEDNALALDYLKESTLVSLGGETNVAKPISGMKLFVNEMIKKFSSEENPQILDKYKYVARYINSRAKK
jgi:hypothetical protein